MGSGSTGPPPSAADLPSRKRIYQRQAKAAEPGRVAPRGCGQRSFCIRTASVSFFFLQSPTQVPLSWQLFKSRHFQSVQPTPSLGFSSAPVRDSRGQVGLVVLGGHSIPECADRGRPVPCAQYPASPPQSFQILRPFPALGLVRFPHRRTSRDGSPSPPSICISLGFLRHPPVCASRSAAALHKCQNGLPLRPSPPARVCVKHRRVPPAGMSWPMLS